MEYLEYIPAKSRYSVDVRRMRAVLYKAGYMASDNDIERLWDDYSSAMCAGWIEIPDDESKLLRILLIGFRIESPQCDEESSIPEHWKIQF